MIVFPKTTLATTVCVATFGAIAPAQSANNGSFDDTAGTYVAGRASQIAPGWTSVAGTPDWDRPPGTIGLSHPASPDGGHWMGMLGQDDPNQPCLESISQTISGFAPGRTYWLTFHQINMPTPFPAPGFTNDDGYVQATMFGTTKKSPTLIAGGNAWSTVTLPFVANASNTTLKFDGCDANPGSGSGQNVQNPSVEHPYLGIDGVLIESVPSRLLGPLRNIDVKNTTGQDANDFHITLEGVSPDQVGSILWTKDYPDAEKTAVPGGTRISWRGATTTDGQKSHFGYRLIGTETAALIPDGVKMEWTLDGVPIGTVPATSQIWRPLPGGGVQGEVRLHDFDEAEVYASIRVGHIPGEATLEDLVVDSRIWETAELLSSEPILLQPGEPLQFDIMADPMEEVSPTVIYDLLRVPIDPTLPREELEDHLFATYYETVPVLPSISIDLLGDIDRDGTVGFSDFLILSANFGLAGTLEQGDIDDNGLVEFADFLLLSGNFGASINDVADVPEPSSLAILLLGLCLIPKLTPRAKS